MTAEQMAVVERARELIKSFDGDYGYQGCAITTIQQLLRVVEEMDEHAQYARNAINHNAELLSQFGCERNYFVADESFGIKAHRLGKS